jgi:benzil reductase ((S)-benzoin forming)
MNLYIITGTTKGLGEALLKSALEDQNNAVLTISRSASVSTDRHFNINFDLSKPHSVSDVWAMGVPWLNERIAKASRLVLINNAGVVAPVAPLTQCYGSPIEHNIQVNLTAPLMLMHHFLALTVPAELKRSIINISSGAGRKPIASWASYCSSKAGLDMASRVIVEEAAQHGWNLNVCSLAPGVIDTPMQAQLRAVDVAKFADVERFRSLKSDGNLSLATDVAKKILALDLANKLPNGLADLRELSI